VHGDCEQLNGVFNSSLHPSPHVPSRCVDKFFGCHLQFKKAFVRGRGTRSLSMLLGSRFANQKGRSGILQVWMPVRVIEQTHLSSQMSDNAGAVDFTLKTSKSRSSDGGRGRAQQFKSPHFVQSLAPDIGDLHLIVRDDARKGGYA
jgi:hypothetical protein